jgi:hypothetical protein
MATKLSKRSISELMRNWGRKGGCRATEKQKHAAIENLKRTPNYRKHSAQMVDTVNKGTHPSERSDGADSTSSVVGDLPTPGPPVDVIHKHEKLAVKSSPIATEAMATKENRMMITDKQFDVLIRENYPPTFAARLTSRQASKIISGILAGNKGYKITPYDHEKVMASANAVLAEMERSE